MKYSLDKSVAVKDIQEELFLFNRNSGRVHSFNDTGRTIILNIQKKSPRKAIIDALCDEYDISRATASSDLEIFIRELLEHGFITPFE